MTYARDILAPFLLANSGQASGRSRSASASWIRSESGAPSRSASFAIVVIRLGLRMIKGLANGHAASIVAARADQPFASVEDLWRRVRLPIASLTRIAEADGFRPSLGLSRREALWAVKGLGPEELPLFAAAREASERQEGEAREDADATIPQWRNNEPSAEAEEPNVTVRPMTLGREVVEDYGHTGLSLRRHPVSFLRKTLEPVAFNRFPIRRL